jgi:DegV family protein with EDD domain
VIQSPPVSQPTAIVADTTSYLPPEMNERHDIHLVSLYVQLEGEQQAESEITDYDAFYERLRGSADSVTTSQPSIGDFIAVYEPLLAEGRDIVSVHISAGISGTFEAANQARERLISDGKGGERIHTVDSRSAAGGTAMVLLSAAIAATGGGGAADVVKQAEFARDNQKIWFSLDTLEYLRRGGRIGKAQAWLGGTLKIKPILSLEYEITPVERVRTAGRAFERMVDYAKELHAGGADGWVVQHIQAPDQAQRLIDRCREIFDSEPVFSSEVGPVIGTYTGPGLIGVGGVPRSLLS